MSELLSLAETFIRFAWWQSTLILIAALLVSRSYRSQPWRQHLLLSVGVFFAATTPLVSILCQELGWGLLPVIESPLDTSQQGRASADHLFHALGWCMSIGGLVLGFLVLWGIAASSKTVLPCCTTFRSKTARNGPRERQTHWTTNRAHPVSHSDLVRGPTIWCWGIHPALLFPPGMLEQSNPEIRDAVFLHELAHLQRFDHWIQFLATCCGCLLFWNPLYWIARRQSDLHADQACDGPSPLPRLRQSGRLRRHDPANGDKSNARGGISFPLSQGEDYGTRQQHPRFRPVPTQTDTPYRLALELYCRRLVRSPR